MKVACLSCFVPRYENVNGPSGLLYQKLKWRPSNSLVTVFIFGQFSEEYRELPEIIELAAEGVIFVTCQAASPPSRTPCYWPLGARNIAKSKMPNLDEFEAVWGYPYWFAPFLLDINVPLLISGMDCATLLYWRRLKNAPIFPPSRFLRVVAGLAANAYFELRYLRNCRVHVVGQKDAATLRWMGVKSIYISHPFLGYRPVHRPVRKIGNSLNILISNPGDPIYGSPRYLRWIRDLFDCVRGEFFVRLIVHKGSNGALDAIKNAARNEPDIEIAPIAWIDDYSSLLVSVDIQLFPLDVGAGTKTSVLTALQHGVRAVCTTTAAENVHPNPLLFVVDDQTTNFKEMLTRACAAVMKENAPFSAGELCQHSPERCGAQFWELLEKNVD